MGDINSYDLPIPVEIQFCGGSTHPATCSGDYCHAHLNSNLQNAYKYEDYGK
jgi:hypothetical protein